MTTPRMKLDRRGFLAAAGAGLSASLLRSGVALAAQTAAARATANATPPGDLLVQPQQIISHAGVLNATLTAAAGSVDLDNGIAFSGFLYNGAYLPPLLRARTGDVMRIRLRNDLPQDPTNLHFHGLGVSPSGNSDNVFIHVHPGSTFDYEVRVPAHDRQGPGLFWYHPDAHGLVAKQILGGEDMTDSAKDHVAVHELVHYLQHQSGRFDLRSCLDTDKREQEAFRVQSRFVAEVQNGFTKFMLNHLACQPEP